MCGRGAARPESGAGATRGAAGRWGWSSTTLVIEADLDPRPWPDAVDPHTGTQRLVCRPIRPPPPGDRIPRLEPGHPMRSVSSQNDGVLSSDATEAFRAERARRPTARPPHRWGKERRTGNVVGPLVLRSLRASLLVLRPRFPERPAVPRQGRDRPIAGLLPRGERPAPVGRAIWTPSARKGHTGLDAPARIAAVPRPGTGSIHGEGEPLMAA